MPRFEPSKAPSPPVWVDGTAYATRLLAGGTAPWLDVDACLAWLRKSQGLLQSAVQTLPAEPLIRAWVAAHPDLAEAMDAQRRSIVPLKTLLGDEALRSHLQTLLAALRSGTQGPLALRCPSPRGLLRLSQALAGRDPEVDDDSVDSAAMYLADWLRAITADGADIDVLMLDEPTSDPANDDAAVALYGAVFNVAEHQRWQLGLWWPGEALGRQGAIAFHVCSNPQAGDGRCIPAEQLLDSDAAQAGNAAFLAAVVPADGDPEAVLAALDRLRA